jgi:hypothetical protein
MNSTSPAGKYADANYITVFDKDTGNVYDANDTIIERCHLTGMAGHLSAIDLT